MKDALAIHRMLLERETLHEIVRLRRAITNAGDLPYALGLPAERCLATRIFAFGTGGLTLRHLAAVVVPAGSKPSPDLVRVALGAQRIRPASPDRVNTVTQYAAELVAPLLLPPGMPVLVEQRILDGVDADDVVYITTGEPYTACGIRMLDLLALSGGRPATLLASGEPVPAADA